MNEIEQKILDQFNALVPQLEKWGQEVDDYLGKVLLGLIHQHKVKMMPKYRLKEPNSYVFKALYRKKNYHDPILLTEDKVGTRIVLLKSEDIKEALGLILDFEGWHSKITKDIEQAIEDKPEAFGYQSAHVVVWPKAGGSKYPDDEIEKLTCEIQIRTLLQHAYAEVSHDSTYKGPFKNDHEILRKLSKAMALMEATDDYFCKIFEMLNDETRGLTNLVKELVRLFNDFVKFDKGQLDHVTTEKVLDLYLMEPVDLNDLEVFVQKHKGTFERKISEKNGLLFTQPVIILLLYYLQKNQYFLKENWPFSNDSLRAFFRTMGVNYENY